MSRMGKIHDQRDKIHDLAYRFICTYGVRPTSSATCRLGNLDPYFVRLEDSGDLRVEHREKNGDYRLVYASYLWLTDPDMDDAIEVLRRALILEELADV